MKGKPLIAAALVLALIGAAAGILHHAKSGQRHAIKHAPIDRVYARRLFAKYSSINRLGNPTAINN